MLTSSCEKEDTNVVDNAQVEQIHMCIDKDNYNPDGQTNKGILLNSEKWTVGQTIRIKFLNGDSFLQGKVKQYASEWLNHANLYFQFVPSTENADVKINFDASGQSWSAVGKTSKNTAQNSPSMNFGWFTSSTPNDEFSRVVIHEFGHALGLVHEHQHPTYTIPWDKPKVYDYFAKPPNNFSKGRVDSEIFSRYFTTSTNYTSYDKASIMHYFYPAGLTTDGSSFTMNRVLSPTDKTFIKNTYPFTGNELREMYQYRYGGKYFYTAAFSELGTNSYEGVVGKVNMFQVAGSEPIYRYNTKTYNGHFYSLDATNLSWMQYEGVLGYAFRTQKPGTKAIYRYYNSTAVDHFYTADYNALGSGKYGYVYEGIAFYILP